MRLNENALLRKRWSVPALVLIFMGACLSPPCLALEPNEILLIANHNASGSVDLARHYMEVRGVPKRNLLELRVTDREWCSRDEYDTKVAGPVRAFLDEKDPRRKIRCLLTVYGVPLKILPPDIQPHEKARLDALEKTRASLKSSIGKHTGPKDESVKELERELKSVQSRIADLKRSNQGAALDSELALVRLDAYSLAGWKANPFFLGYRNTYVLDMPSKAEVMMVSRLDAPSPEIVRKVVHDSLETEKDGLEGTAYFDARWRRPKKEEDEKILTGYPFYDRAIHFSAESIEKAGRMKVVLDDDQRLFQPGECPDAALYCGWYSLAKYVDAFQWRRGAVGYHIASAECRTLRHAKSTVWCKRMLEEGVAATLGPVSEPYVQAFPIPDLFFRLLLSGDWTLAETYALSQPFWSWQMVLLGDPLYNPFKKNKNR